MLRINFHELTRYSLISTLASCWSQGGGEGSNRFVVNLRSLPHIQICLLLYSKTKAVVVGFARIKMDLQVPLWIEIVEGWLLVGIHPPDRPNHVQLLVQFVFLVSGISRNQISPIGDRVHSILPDERVYLETVVSSNHIITAHSLVLAENLNALEDWKFKFISYYLNQLPILTGANDVML